MHQTVENKEITVETCSRWGLIDRRQKTPLKKRTVWSIIHTSNKMPKSQKEKEHLAAVCWKKYAIVTDVFRSIKL